MLITRSLPVAVAAEPLSSLLESFKLPEEPHYADLPGITKEELCTFIDYEYKLTAFKREYPSLKVMAKDHFLQPCLSIYTRYRACSTTLHAVARTIRFHASSISSTRNTVHMISKARTLSSYARLSKKGLAGRLLHTRAPPVERPLK